MTSLGGNNRGGLLPLLCTHYTENADLVLVEKRHSQLEHIGNSIPLMGENNREQPSPHYYPVLCLYSSHPFGARARTAL